MRRAGDFVMLETHRRTSKVRQRLPRQVERKVLRFIRERGVLEPGERVLMGVSGGPDSVALLQLLFRLREDLGIEIVAAYFDHGLRGEEEAVADIALVRLLAGEAGVPVMVGAGDVKAFSRAKGLSIEDAARRLRYDFLAREAVGLGAAVVATGHTAADQAETVLLHLIRGAGLHGLRGMAPRSAWPFPGGVRGQRLALGRPLLCLAREETEAYCAAMGITPRRDASNMSPEVTRNRVRHQLLPLLRKINPRVQDSLLRLSAAATLDSEYLDRATDALWETMAQETDARVTFPREPFSRLPAALALRLLRRSAQCVAGAARREDGLEAVHLQSILSALRKTRSRLSLPGGLTCTVSSHSVTIRSGPSAPRRRIAETPLNVPGETALPGWLIEADLNDFPPFTIPENRREALLDADKAGQGLVVRGRLPGDRLRPLGLNGGKKLQDLLVDARVPQEERDNIPLVCNDNGLIWVVGFKIDEAYAITRSTLHALHLRATQTTT